MVKFRTRIPNLRLKSTPEVGAIRTMAVSLASAAILFDMSSVSVVIYKGREYKELIITFANRNHTIPIP